MRFSSCSRVLASSMVAGVLLLPACGDTQEEPPSRAGNGVGSQYAPSDLPGVGGPEKAAPKGNEADGESKGSTPGY